MTIDKVVLLLLVVVSIVSCGGGGSSSNTTDDSDNTPITINKLYLVAVTPDFRFSAVGDLMYTPIVQSIQ